METPAASLGADRSMYNTVPSHRADAHIRQCPVGSRASHHSGRSWDAVALRDGASAVRQGHVPAASLPHHRLHRRHLRGQGRPARRPAWHYEQDSWAETTAPWAGAVLWVPRARWVEDGNVWTSSGISAGIDATLAFAVKVYGKANATRVANLMEYDWHEDPD